MPLYEYYCSDCRHKFEVLTSYAASSSGVRCPTCQGDRARKLFSVFARAGRGSDGDFGEGAYGDDGDYEASAGGCSCGGACSCGGH